MNFYIHGKKCIIQILKCSILNTLKSGLLTFTPSISEWVEQTNAIGLYVKKGRYGGTFAHKDIAFEFASAISLYFQILRHIMHRWFVRVELKKERLEILKNIAEYQIRILNEAQNISNRIGEID